MREWEEGIKAKDIPTLEELYERQGLTDSEKEILGKYRKYIDKIYQRLGFNFSFLASMLSSFESPSVNGPKVSFIKKLFAKHLDMVVTERAKGFRVGTKSGQFYDVLFELWLIHRFVELGFQVELISEKLGGKVPEFQVTKDEIEYLVEAKRVDDSILDWVFKDVDEAFFKGELQGGGPVELTEEQVDGILEVLDRNFNNALSKFSGSEIEAIIFIRIGYPPSILGSKITNWFDELAKDLDEGKFGNLSGVFFIYADEAMIVENRSSRPRVKSIFGASDFNYVPRIPNRNQRHKNSLERAPKWRKKFRSALRKLTRQND